METELFKVRNIYGFNQSKTFSHEEALELVSLLTLISAKTKRELNLLNSQLSFFQNQSEQAKKIQHQIDTALQKWSDKVRRLGAIPVALCKVRIPGEENHFIWEYPENRLFMQ